MPTRHRVLKQSKIEKKAKVGAVIYAFTGPHTYGLVALDNRKTGIKNGAFTLKQGGSYPFFTMPLSDVERL